MTGLCLLLYFSHLIVGILRTTKPREPPLFQQSRTLEKEIQEKEKLIETLQKQQAGVKVGLTLGKPFH